MQALPVTTVQIILTNTSEAPGGAKLNASQERLGRDGEGMDKAIPIFLELLTEHVPEPEWKSPYFRVAQGHNPTRAPCQALRRRSLVLLSHLCSLHGPGCFS